MNVEIAQFDADTGVLRIYSREPGPKEILAEVEVMDTKQAHELIAAARSLYEEGWRAGRADTVARVVTAVAQQS